MNEKRLDENGLGESRPVENMRCELEELPPAQSATSANDAFIHLPPTTKNDSDSAFRVPPSALPFVSVVIPCYNEERFIEKVLENLSGQYESAAYEIIVVDGMSEDGTRACIERFRREHPETSVRVLDNAERNIPAALNLGIEAARGDIVVRMDAHSVASGGYVRRCVEVLRRGEASVVGMPWRIRPGAESLVARAIALAVAHPFGIGDAKYRLSDTTSATEQSVDTVPFGSFRKELWQRLSGFNEDLLANEDYDFNYRVRMGGGRVVLDTSEHCDYFARATLRDLAAQYARYGNWKAQMLKLHPRSARWRHLVAPVFVASMFVLGAVGFFWPVAWALLTLEMGAYLALALVCAAQLARKSGDARLLFVLPLVFFTIHFVWGGSFLTGLLRSERRRSARALSKQRESFE